MESVLQISINTNSMLDKAIRELKTKSPVKMKTQKNIFKRILNAVNLYHYWRRLLIYRRLKKVAKAELATIHRAQKDYRLTSTSAQEHVRRLNSYIGSIASMYHYGYRMISKTVYMDGRTEFKISKDRIREETSRVFLEEQKKLAIS